MGVKLMDLEGDDRLIAAARVAERDDEVELAPPPETSVPGAVDETTGDEDEGGDDTPPDTIH
jgi:hypothetical protein